MVGYYGYNCNISCDGCLSNACDSEYGICTDVSGCKPGWLPKQPKCDLGILMKNNFLFYQKVTDKFIIFHNAYATLHCTAIHYTTLLYSTLYYTTNYV